MKVRTYAAFVVAKYLVVAILIVAIGVSNFITIKSHYRDDNTCIQCLAAARAHPSLGFEYGQCGSLLTPSTKR